MLKTMKKALIVFLIPVIALIVSAESRQVSSHGENELYQAYEAFTQYVEDNHFPLQFDYDYFKEIYTMNGYTDVDDYINDLYVRLYELVEPV